MPLSNDLLSQFAKATASNKRVDTESTVYGTVVEYEGKNYVRLDGSDMLTPMSSVVSASPGERVAIRIKNHSATVTGNMSSPSARVGSVEEIEGKTKVYIDSIEGRVLVYDEAYVDKIEAIEGDFVDLKAETGEFYDLVTENLEAKQAAIEELTVKTAEIDNLDTKFANIDFANIGEAAFKKIFSGSGLIKDLVVGDQTITGHLVGVTISGDLIEGNTVKADKLVVKGSDGLYYKLNVTERGVTPEEYEGYTDEEKSALQNGLHGSNIITRTITAEKVSVSDLVAFDARLANFTIGLDDEGVGSIYSGVKSSVDNTTEGIYLDSEGQMNIGGTSQYLKYYKTEDGSYKLEIRASSIRLGSTGQTVEEALENIVNPADVAGRNLLVDTGTSKAINHAEAWVPNGVFDEIVYDDSKNAYDSLADGIVRLCSYEGAENAYFFYTNDSLLHWLEPNTEYVFSCDIMFEEDVTDLKVGISNTQGLNPQTDFVTFGSTCVAWEWTHVECKLTSPATIPTTTGLTEQGVRMYLGSTIHWVVDIKNIKLEKGSVGTYWIPALEDYASGNDLDQYTTKEEFDSLEIGARNLVRNSDFSDGTNLWVINGVTTEVHEDETHGTCLKITSTAAGDTNNRIYPSTSDNFVHAADSDGNPSQYYLSFYAKSDTAGTYLVTNVAGENIVTASHRLTTEWQRFTFAYSADYGSMTFWLRDADTSAYITKVQIERGDKVTDWTLATEDMATSGSLENLESNTNAKFEDTDERIALAEEAIIDINNIIRMLVTNKDGTSLMTQTETGWTFCTSELQTAVDNVSAALDTLTQDSADFKAAIAALQQSVDDHGNTLEYVTITTYEDEPCIALGESDSEFKLLITNTRIMFMHGSTLLTYINTKGLVTENIEVTGDLRQGSFVWAVRANGNYGLTWKEVTE